MYHNAYGYNRDDYAIFDSVFCDNLYKYISQEDYERITGKKIRKNSFYKMKDNFDYLEYIKIINYIIK
jgi:hypothetical protein